MCLNAYVDVRLHPLFQDWLERLAESAELHDVFAEVMALIAALENYGRD